MKKIILLAVLALTLAAGSVFAEIKTEAEEITYFSITTADSYYGNALVIRIPYDITEIDVVYPITDDPVNQQIIKSFLTTIALAKSTNSKVTIYFNESGKINKNGVLLDCYLINAILVHK